MLNLLKKASIKEAKVSDFSTVSLKEKEAKKVKGGYIGTMDIIHG